MVLAETNMGRRSDSKSPDQNPVAEWWSDETCRDDLLQIARGHDRMGTFEANLSELQPSQLYICTEKLTAVERSLRSAPGRAMEPAPIARLGLRMVLTDGHTRAFAAFRQGRTSVPAYWETDELDWEAYEICVQWCHQEGIYSTADLRSRVVTADRYEVLWHERCRAMHERLAQQRQSRERAE